MPGTKDNDKFMTATDIIEEVAKQSFIKVSSIQLGKELKFLGYKRIQKRVYGFTVYGYSVSENIEKLEKQ